MKISDPKRQLTGIFKTENSLLVSTKEYELYVVAYHDPE